MGRPLAEEALKGTRVEVTRSVREETREIITVREASERILKEEEAHVDWLEAQLHQIKELGYERYLSQQIRDEK